MQSCKRYNVHNFEWNNWFLNVQFTCFNSNCNYSDVIHIFVVKAIQYDNSKYYHMCDVTRIFENQWKWTLW